jgi:hypothetical protein
VAGVIAAGPARFVALLIDLHEVRHQSLLNAAGAAMRLSGGQATRRERHHDQGSNTGLG